MKADSWITLQIAQINDSSSIFLHIFLSAWNLSYSSHSFQIEPYIFLLFIPCFSFKIFLILSRCNIKVVVFFSISVLTVAYRFFLNDCAQTWFFKNSKYDKRCVHSKYILLLVSLITNKVRNKSIVTVSYFLSIITWSKQTSKPQLWINIFLKERQLLNYLHCTSQFPWSFS